MSFLEKIQEARIRGKARKTAKDAAAHVTRSDAEGQLFNDVLTYLRVEVPKQVELAFASGWDGVAPLSVMIPEVWDTGVTVKAANSIPEVLFASATPGLLSIRLNFTTFEDGE